MAKKELHVHAVVAPTQTVVVSAYDKDGKADACTPAKDRKQIGRSEYDALSDILYVHYLNDKGDSYGDDFENGVEILRDSNTDEMTGFQVNSVSFLTDLMLLTYSVLSDNMAVGYPTLILFQGGASYANSYPRIRCQTRFQKKTYTSQHKL